MDFSTIEQVVTKVVTEYLKTANTNTAIFEKKETLPSVIKKSIADVKRVQFDTGNANDKVWVTDMFSTEESPRIGCGLMEMENSSFAWTLNYDEMDIVLEGTLIIQYSNGKESVCKSGDVVYIPKGSSIVFKTPNYAKFVYVVHPANWQETK